MKKLFQIIASLLLVFFLFITCSKDDNTVIQYTLSVEVNPAEGGSVSPSSGKYDDGETITLLATPSTEYIFKNWSGGASGTSNPTTTIMNSNKAVTAVFEKRQYPLTIEIEGEGTVTEELLSAKSASDFPSGSSVQLTAVPANGWEFVEWSGDLTGVDNPTTISVDKPKNIKAKFQPILYNQIIGKWDVNNLSGKPSSNKSSSTQDDTISSKTTYGECIVYSLVFNSDGTFILSLASGEIQGTFTFDSVNSIVLTNVGSVTNISIASGSITFSLSLTNLCSIDGDADNDPDYVEGECVSFLDCNDENVWVKQVENGYKYIRITNNINNIWLENFLFDTTRQCTLSSVNNQTSEFDIILLENDITQMTYVLDNTPNGDVNVIVSITADNHLSVKYDYDNNNLDETDYYELSTEESLNEYLGTYETCPQLTYVPDDNFEQELIDLGYDDVLDDYVITSNINSLSNIILLEKNISDATGIEDFVELESLIIDANNLSEIDISKNINLTRLEASSNKLTSINVSNNINLVKLVLSFNSIEELDLSNNQKLEQLYCDSNQLQNLNIDNNLKLYNIHCQNNQLLSLNISENNDLVYLDCNNNLITSLDVKDNPFLTNLYLWGNQISEIDISSNIELGEFFCMDNNLSELIISNNNKLVDFRCYNNPFTCIQVNETQLNAIPSNWQKDADASYSLDCSLTYVPDDNFEQALIDLGYDDVLDDYVLTQNIENLTTLELQERNITDATGIEDFVSLTHLYFHKNNLESIDLSKNTNLFVLWIFNNNLTSLDVSSILNLGYLFANHNNLNNIDVSKNLELVHLTIGANPLGTIDVSNNKKLVNLDVYNTNLESLNVIENTALVNLRFDNEGPEVYLNTISTIDLSANTELEGLLANNCGLSSLDLSNNSKLEQLEIRNTGVSNLDVSNMNNLNILYTEGTQISCIQVNETQLNNIPSGWSKDDTASYSLDCDNSFKVELGIIGYINSCGVEAEYFYYEINYKFDDNDVIFDAAEGFEGTSYNHSQEMVCYNNLEIDILLGSFNPDIPSESFKGTYLDNMTLKITDLKTNQVVLDTALPRLFICTDVAYKNIINFNPNTSEYSIDTLTFGF